MGAPLPFLPFSGEIEKKAFAVFVLRKQDVASIDDEAAAILWCEFVDGKDIMPKLPSHMRTHLANWERNQRIKECEAREASKNALLTELNEKIAPVYDSSNTTPNTSDTAMSSDGNDNGNCNLQTSVPPIIIPTRQCWQLSPIIPAGMFFTILPEAIVHNLQNMIVGGMCVSPHVENPMRAGAEGRQVQT